jgi:hypothetical protein
MTSEMVYLGFSAAIPTGVKAVNPAANARLRVRIRVRCIAMRFWLGFRRTTQPVSGGQVNKGSRLKTTGICWAKTNGRPAWLQISRWGPFQASGVYPRTTSNRAANSPTRDFGSGRNGMITDFRAAGSLISFSTPSAALPGSPST